MNTRVEPHRVEDREILHTTYSGYLNGHCYAFGIALSRDLGWPMFGLMEGDVPAHVVLRTPSGLLDYRGEKFTGGDPALGRMFGLRPPYVIKPVQESDLRAVRPIHEQEIKNARAIAEALWPEYPWPNPIQRRMIAFTDELEALSRKYGIWLRAPYPVQQPILYVEEEDKIEDGYDLQVMTDGRQYRIDRRLK